MSGETLEIETEGGSDWGRKKRTLRVETSLPPAGPKTIRRNDTYVGLDFGGDVFSGKVGRVYGDSFVYSNGEGSVRRSYDKPGVFLRPDERGFLRPVAMSGQNMITW